ncbi:MAG TPA: sulfatase-like hydrolase/transferase [Chitinophagales bacterium]|nr:sulfatase-like hydrolase/transferase [Chitinophagales bacterium]
MKFSLSSSSFSAYFFSLLKIFLYWLLIFFINRLAFIIFFHKKFSGISFIQVIATFIHGFKLDVSMMCYIVAIPVFMLIVQQFFRFNFFKAFLFIYSILVLLLDAFISIFDMGIYHDWNTHLNYRAISYLHYVNEASAFSDAHQNFILAVLMVMQIIIGVVVLIYFFSVRSPSERRDQFHFPWNRKSFVPGVLFHAAIFPLLFLGIRGGLQLIPINESSAYFSSEKILNDAAVNALWNAGKKFSGDKESLHSNPYQFFPEQEAEAIVKELYSAKKDSVISILTTQRPNIILFVLESFTADVIEALGGDKGVTPNLDTVIRHGLLFTDIYSQGYRTDQGLADVFSGFPATPNFSIMMQPEKYPKLSFLPKVLADAGYQNSFYYGGELDFANMKAYLLQSGVSDLHDKSSYTKDEMNAKWGAHDEFVFRKEANDTASKREPFFSTVLSLSSHEPFQVPMQTKFPGEDDPSKFKNSCYYTDRCIGEYMKLVSHEQWYKNTLFIFIADHGHILPRNRNPEEAARFHIPIILYGDVLRPEFKGTTIGNIGMQSDLPATILAQLNLSNNQFQWSNDLLNFYRNNFAYYSFDAGIGFVNNDGSMRYDFNNKKATVSGDKFSEKDTDEGRAFLQKLFGEYVSF